MGRLERRQWRRIGTHSPFLILQNPEGAIIGALVKVGWAPGSRAPHRVYRSVCLAARDCFGAVGSQLEGVVARYNQRARACTSRGVGPPATAHVAHHLYHPLPAPRPVDDFELLSGCTASMILTPTADGPALDDALIQATLQRLEALK